VVPVNSAAIRVNAIFFMVTVYFEIPARAYVLIYIPIKIRF
jgi:hypothetical protein